MSLEFDFSDIKPSVFSAVIIFLVVVITVPFAKWAFNRWQIPGFTQLVNAI